MQELYQDEHEKPVKALLVFSFLILLAALCFGYTVFIIAYLRDVFGQQDKQLFFSISCLSLAAFSTAIT
jgi:hypothetical protein